jgi:hypothetical protein
VLFIVQFTITKFASYMSEIAAGRLALFVAYFLPLPFSMLGSPIRLSLLRILPVPVLFHQYSTLSFFPVDKKGANGIYTSAAAAAADRGSAGFSAFEPPIGRVPPVTRGRA